MTGPAGRVPAAGSPREQRARRGLLEKLLACVRPEFRQDVLVFAPGDPVFGGAGVCQISGVRAFPVSFVVLF